jgi:hypothetical protein
MIAQRLDRWLAAMAMLHVIGGLALPFVLLYTPLLDGLMPVASSAARLAYALFGPTVASWGLLMLYLVRHGIARNQAWAANALIGGILVWVPLDTALCHVHGWQGAVVLNATAATAILVPAIWRRMQISRGTA